MKVKDIKINEFLLAIYIFIFPSLSRFYNNSPKVTYGIIFGVLLMFFVKNFKETKISVSFIFVNFLILFLFGVTYLFYNNIMLKQYFLNYILYGFITMLLFTKVKCYDSFLKYTSYICVILFLLSFSAPFNNYAKYSGYMSYGLFCVLPCFIIFHIQRKYYNKKYFIVFELLSCFSLLYANRNSILICIVAVFLLDMILKKNNSKKKLKYIAILIVVFIILFNLQEIINYLCEIFGSNSYALRALKNWIDGTNSGLAGRDKIWSNAFKEFSENPILGIGIGGYHSQYGMYCHNIIVEFLVSFGSFGIIFFILLFAKSVYKIFKEKNVLSIYLMIMGILPLMFNNYFMAWKFFWLLLIYTFSPRIEGDENE